LSKESEGEKKFKDTRIGDQLLLNIVDVFTDTSKLNLILKKLDVNDINDVTNITFNLTIKSIKKYQNAQLDQTLFDKLFPTEKVADFADFESRIKDNIAKSFAEASEAAFKKRFMEYLLEKNDPSLPETYLRKWMRLGNPSLEENDFEEKFATYIKNVKLELLIKNIIKKENIEVHNDEIMTFAKDMLAKSMLSYGMQPGMDIKPYVDNYLKSEENINAVAMQLFTNKMIDKVYDIVDITEENVSPDEMNNILTQNNTLHNEF
jgi:trigger factor